MKIHINHILKYLDEQVKINDLSDKLFQLGHEHEIIDDNIFDFEFTPNRGDCLSIIGILRDLKLFYKVKFHESLYEKEINKFPFNFHNNLKKKCIEISFLKLEIDELPKKYNGPLESYFDDLDNKKNNFFTDISNYISYETGQPTHCYDSKKLGEQLRLDKLNKDCDFKTLLDTSIKLSAGDMVFFNANDEVVNLAGIIGGKNTACDIHTKSVIIECANFDSESIVGKAVKYNINSEAAYKFERGTDPFCHDFVFKRFIHIVSEHANLKKIQLFSESSKNPTLKKIPFEYKKINQILGTKILEKDIKLFLKKLGFNLERNMIVVPSYRNDIDTINDISEEIARALGYNNILSKSFELPHKEDNYYDNYEFSIKTILINHGFFEVINNPFVSNGDKDSIKVDNPLDTNKSYIRTNLKQSLIDNLLYNERRQQDIIKLFEISDIYNSTNSAFTRVLGIIATGRVGDNYKDFSKKINKNYISTIFKDYGSNINTNVEEISRKDLNSKHKSPICYLEIKLDLLKHIKYEPTHTGNKIEDKHYLPISDYPKSKRDISFLINDPSCFQDLEKIINSLKYEALKEIFIFDCYNNPDKKEIKVGYRFIFQMQNETITDELVNNIMEKIIKKATSVKSVSIPGL